jgi:quercetin dioxygenase-like cupin family protein
LGKEDDSTRTFTIRTAVPFSRRTFLKTALPFPALLRAQADIPAIQRQDYTMEIKRSGSQPSTQGSAEYFTGTVRIDPLFQPKEPARALGASVTFEPGARTAWHTHPLGQILIVTAGCGRVQRWGGPIEAEAQALVHMKRQHRQRGTAREVERAQLGECGQRVDANVLVTYGIARR